MEGAKAGWSLEDVGMASAKALVRVEGIQGDVE
jgi:hypothetical protein